MTEFTGIVKLFSESDFSPVKTFGSVSLVSPFMDLNLPPTLKHDVVTVTQQNINDKYFTLSAISRNPSTALFLPEGGIPQFFGSEFTIEGDILSWDGLGLEGFIETNEIIHIYFS